MGLGTVTILFASHEWSSLKLASDGTIIGDEAALSRLASLAGLTVKWFAVAGAVVAIGLVPAGFLFFEPEAATHVSWQWPWILLCLATGLSLVAVPFRSLLEGCNQVASVYQFSTWERIAERLATWTAIVAGTGLWTAFAATITSNICHIGFFAFRYWKFFQTLLVRTPIGPRIRWKDEVFPFQWRIALSWMCFYFNSSFPTLVVFKYHGAVAAGQFGMTNMLVFVIALVSGSWITSRIPTFGLLVAAREYEKLDELFWRITRVVIGVSVLLAIGVIGVVYGLNALSSPLAQRLLTPIQTTILAAAMVILMPNTPIVAYLRAHKREPILGISVLHAMSTGLCSLVAAKYYSVTVVVFCFLANNCIAVPIAALIWYMCRKAWHSGIDRPSPTAKV